MHVRRAAPLRILQGTAVHGCILVSSHREPSLRVKSDKLTNNISHMIRHTMPYCREYREDYPRAHTHTSRARLGNHSATHTVCGPCI